MTGLAEPDHPSSPSGLQNPGRPTRGLAGELAVTAVLATVAGLLIAVLWSRFAGDVARASVSTELDIAHDALLGLLGIVAGIMTAGLLIAFPGPSPARRVAITLALVTGASFLAWGVGRSMGAPVLNTVGMVLLWPLVTGILTTLHSLFAMLFSRA